MNRGLTLIEVVAATALLTLVTAACIPILEAARRDLAAAQQTSQAAPNDRFERAVTDLLTQRPALAGDLLEHPEGLDLSWTSHESDYSALARIGTVTRAADDERRSTHCWVSFQTRETIAVRWLRVSDRLLEPAP